MSQTPLRFKVLGLALFATLMGGLLFAQPKVSEEEVPLASPSDQQAVAEQSQAAETPEATSGAEVEVVTPSEVAPSDVPEPTSAPVAAAAPDSIDRPSEDINKATWQRVIASLWVFVLAIFIGFAVITKVPPTLHTPLMSGSNAISGITLVGAVIVAASMSFSGLVGFIAVALATVNAVGGFMVTHRMLAMFKKR